LARRLGWTDDQINNLADFEKRSDFTEAEKAAVRLAERMTLDAHKSGRGVVEAVAAAFR